jgi:RES domain-containing protein
MIVYRISNKLFSQDLTGKGAKLYGARWNPKGTAMLYTSAYISLALLEMLVHTQFKDYAIELDIVYIQLPDAGIKEITLPKLKDGWTEDVDYTKFIGDEFVKSKQFLVLKVPSSVVHDEHNYIVNPLHADFKKIKIVKTKSFRPDKRLLIT